MAGKRTPLYQNHVTAGARLVDFAGWDMPQQYTSVRDEQESVRTAAGLFDVSHMGRYEIRGPAAGDFLQSLVTNDLGRLRLDQAQYNLLCKPDGGVLDDLVVYRRPGSWWVVVNAANREKDMAWLRRHERPGMEIVDQSGDVSLVALQGPKAAEMLPVDGIDLSAVAFFGVG